MSNLGINPAVWQAACDAFDEFRRLEVDFYNTKENRDVLQSYLRGKLSPEDGVIPLEHWVHPNVWMAAYGQCKSRGLLEPVRPKETPQERAARLEQQDRSAGSLNANASAARHQETVQEEFRRKAAEKAKSDAEAIARIKANTTARSQKAAAENDVSMVPSVAHLQVNPMTDAEAGVFVTQNRYSVPQIKKLLANRQEAYRQNEKMASLERGQKIQASKEKV
jgi:hypothetical protein